MLYSYCIQVIVIKWKPIKWKHFNLPNGLLLITSLVGFLKKYFAANKRPKRPTSAADNSQVEKEFVLFINIS